MVGRSEAASPVIRQAAVIALCTREGNAREIARELGIRRETLYNWKNQLLGRQASGPMKRHHNKPSASELDALEQQLAALRREVHRLQLEQDVLTATNEILKKDVGIDRKSLSNREKTLLVDALKKAYAVSDLLQQVSLARSSYLYHRARLDATDKYVEVRRIIAEIFENNHRCYGYRRIQASLSRQRVSISEKVVQRLMRQEQLVATAPKRRRYGSWKCQDFCVLSG